MSVPTVAPTPFLGRDVVRGWLLAASFAMLFALGMSNPNATQPDLAGTTPLPFHFAPATVTALMWGAIALGAVAVWLGLGRPTRPLTRVSVVALGVFALFTSPIGSADHLNYAAYGRILVQGGDPYLESPIAWQGGHDPVTSHVEEPWTTEPSVYGPAATLLQGLAARLGGDDVRHVVFAWQVIVVLAWFAVRWLLRRLLDPRHHGRIDVVWTANPLVFAVGVLGAHVDMVSTAFAVAAVWALARLPWPVGPPVAGLWVGLAGSTKVTYAVVGAGLLGALWVTRERRPRWRVEAAAMTIVGLVTLVALHVWAGPHVFDQLGRGGQMISLASPVRVLLALAWLVTHSGARTVVFALAPLLAIGVAVLLARASRPVTVWPGAGCHSELPLSTDPDAELGVVAAWLTAVLSAAYVLVAPYLLPWYDTLTWACLPALVGVVVERSLLVQLVVLVAAYVPGRVSGMTAQVQTVTMGFRQYVAPGLLLLVVVTLVVHVLGKWREPDPPSA